MIQNPRKKKANDQKGAQNSSTTHDLFQSFFFQVDLNFHCEMKWNQWLYES